MTAKTIYDVFLCHATKDKSLVEAIAVKLRANRIRPFLDKWHLIPGDQLQKSLEKALDESKTFAIFISSPELGPWQNLEMRNAIEIRAQDPTRRIIPVLLPGEYDPSTELSPFLRQNLWVDFRQGIKKEALHQLIHGINGAFQPRPKTSLHRQRANNLNSNKHPESKSTFSEIITKLENLLSSSSKDICILGLPGSGASTTLKEFAATKAETKLISWRDFTNKWDLSNSLPQTGIIAVLGYPGVQWLAMLKSKIDSTKVRILAPAAVAPSFMETILMPPLTDERLAAILGPSWATRISDAAWATGRSPSAALRLREEDSTLSRDELRNRIWKKKELDDIRDALADLDAPISSFLATIAIRGSINPIERELWIRLLSAASLERYEELGESNPLSPFVLPTSDRRVLLRPEVALFLANSKSYVPLPRLGYQVILELSNPLEIYNLIALAGRETFRSVLDDARSIALTQAEPTTPTEGITLFTMAAPLEPRELIEVKTRWRVLAHIVQLLPTWNQSKSGLPLWNQLLSAIIRSKEIDVRLKGGEELLEDLLFGVRDQLRYHSHWSLKWSRDAIPGPLLSEMQYHEPGIIVPEVNAVSFDSDENLLWSADSAGCVHKWRWRSGKKSRFGPERDFQKGEVWSIAVTQEGLVLSASDDGSVAIRSESRYAQYPACNGGMMNAVAIGEGIVFAGDDDSRVHLWKLVVEEDGSGRLIGGTCIGDADAGWTLCVLAISKYEIFSGHERETVCHWNFDGSSWHLKKINLAGSKWIRTLRRDTQSRAIYAACADGKIYRYFPGASTAEFFVEHGASARGLALLNKETGAFLATGGDDGVIRLWTDNGEEASSFGAHSGMIRALDAKGSLLASAGTDGFARIWNIESTLHPPRMDAMDADEMLVQLVAAETSRAFLASTGRETCLAKGIGDNSGGTPLRVSGHVILVPEGMGEIELPTTCLEARLSSDRKQILASDIGGRIYLFKWSPHAS